MICEIEYNKSHLKQLELQDAQSYMNEEITDKFLHEIEEEYTYAKTWLWKENVVGCGFLFWDWNKMKEWMFYGFFSPLSGPMLIGLRKIFMEFIESRDINKDIYTPIIPEFKEGIRFANILGFKDCGTYVSPSSSKFMKLMKLEF
mgnify:CR=1 FL=1